MPDTTAHPVPAGTDTVTGTAARVHHVVATSSGAGSWAAADRVITRHGADNVTLVFTDVLGEDPDNYRFLRESCDLLGAPLVWIAEGSTIWDVFKAKRFLGNSRLANCSHALKQKPFRDWLDANHDPAATVVHVGIDWSESHRLAGIRAGYAHPVDGGCDGACKSLWDREGNRLEGPGCPRLLPHDRQWHVEAPLTERPWTTKTAILADLRSRGVEPPRLYALGFSHANCLHPDTRYLTDEGVRTLRETLGKTVRVLGRRGMWKDATVASFGEQPLRRVALERDGTTRVVLATPDHLWPVRERPGEADDYRWRPTGLLAPGEVLVSGDGPYVDHSEDWTVVGVTDTGRVEEVMCAVVPDGNVFLLEGGLLTHNCGGGCVRAGQGAFEHLLRVLPDTYAEWEAGENDLRAFLGKDVAILKDRAGGTSVPLTLTTFRERLQSAPEQEGLFDPYDVGGCGCFSDTTPTADEYAAESDTFFADLGGPAGVVPAVPAGDDEGTQLKIA